MGNDVTRRSFLKGIGLAGLSAGALGALGTTGIAFADEETAGTAYEAIATGREKASCPGPRGPVAFEDRTIAASEIVATEECDVLVVGAGIAGLTASLKAAEEGARTVCLEKMTRGRGCFECFGAYDAQAQKDAGIEIDPAQLLDEIYRSAYWRTRPRAGEHVRVPFGRGHRFLAEDARQGRQRLRHHAGGGGSEHERHADDPL